MKKRFVSMLMAILTVFSLMSTTVLAAGAPRTNAVRAAGINIREGSTSIPNKILVFPAYYDGNDFTFDDEDPNCRMIQRNLNGSGTVNLYARVSTAKTNAMLNNFRDKFKENANVWIVVSTFDIYNDTYGSYAKYYKMNPYGQFLLNLENDGTYMIDLSRNSARHDIHEEITLYAIENTTSQYTIGLSGGYYYYNAVNRKTLSKAIGTLVIFNYN